MAVQIHEILQIFPTLLTHVRGDTTAHFEKLQSPAHAEARDLIFVPSDAHLKEALKGHSQLWVVHPSLVEKVPQTIPVLLSTPYVQFAMSQIGAHFFRKADHVIPVGDVKVHPLAVIARTAKIAASCVIGPGAVIGENCELGEDVIIGANSVIEPRCTIGAGTHIHPLVFIGHDTVIGKECEIHPHTTIASEGFGYAQDAQYHHHRITHFGNVVLEDRVHLGAGVQVDRGTFQDSRIQTGTKIDNNCHFGHNIEIGRHTLIAGGIVAAGSGKIGSHCVIGGRSTIAGHIEITDRVQLGGLSSAHGSIREPGQYAGHPLQELRRDLKTRVIVSQLPELAKTIKAIAKQLGIKIPAQEE